MVNFRFVIRLLLHCNFCACNTNRDGNPEGGSLVDISRISATSLGLIRKSDPLIEGDLLFLVEAICDQQMSIHVRKRCSMPPGLLNLFVCDEMLKYDISLISDILDF